MRIDRAMEYGAHRCAARRVLSSTTSHESELVLRDEFLVSTRAQSVLSTT